MLRPDELACKDCLGGREVDKQVVSMKRRKLFCEFSPFCYEISVVKCCLLRRLRDLFSRERFCHKRFDEHSLEVIYKHKSLIRRQFVPVEQPHPLDRSAHAL